MASIRSKNTRPEMVVRRAMHRVGLRYRLHVNELPGKPDLAFPGRGVAIFVHGCFWHSCPHCRDGMKKVKSNLDYWRPKLLRNQARDAINRAALEAAGWRVYVIWECETRNPAQIETLINKVKTFSANSKDLAKLRKRGRTRGSFILRPLTREPQ
jgi:DNA mismatch endonuclease, patch repair protein